MKVMSFANKVNDFLAGLHLAAELPEGVQVMNPYKNKEALELSQQFYSTFYHDTAKRIGIFGINPGRFGAGITGVPFTDPIRLENDCGIPNSFNKRPEMSSEFIYNVIHKYGGIADFCKKHFVTAVCPLGFIKDGKNMNYYDTRMLQTRLEPFIIKTIRQQIDSGLDTRVAICLGEGKNFRYFTGINQKYGFFDKIIPLSHPRYIMQYKRKHLDEYISRYLNVLG